jgi:hypothetical protein
MRSPCASNRPAAQAPCKNAALPGGRETIALDIAPELLAISDLNMKFLEEPGEFENAVGNSSRAGDLQKVILTVR